MSDSVSAVFSQMNNTNRMEEWQNHLSKVERHRNLMNIGKAYLSMIVDAFQDKELFEFLSAKVCEKDPTLSGDKVKRQIVKDLVPRGRFAGTWYVYQHYLKNGGGIVIENDSQMGKRGIKGAMMSSVEMERVGLVSTDEGTLPMDRQEERRESFWDQPKVPYISFPAYLRSRGITPKLLGMNARAFTRLGEAVKALSLGSEVVSFNRPNGAYVGEFFKDIKQMFLKFNSARPFAIYISDGVGIPTIEDLIARKRKFSLLENKVAVEKYLTAFGRDHNSWSIATMGTKEYPIVYWYRVTVMNGKSITLYHPMTSFDQYKLTAKGRVGYNRRMPIKVNILTRRKVIFNNNLVDPMGGVQEFELVGTRSYPEKDEDSGQTIWKVYPKWDKLVDTAINRGYTLTDSTFHKSGEVFGFYGVVRMVFKKLSTKQKVNFFAKKKFDQIKKAYQGQG